MRERAILFLCFVAFAISANLTTPAAATDARGAISLCDARGPDCSYGVHEDGGVTLVVNNGGKQTVIECPLQGNCSVLGRKGGKGTGTAVGSVFKPPGDGALPERKGLVGASGGAKGTTQSDGTQPVGLERDEGRSVGKH